MLQSESEKYVMYLTNYLLIIFKKHNSYKYFYRLLLLFSIPSSPKDYTFFATTIFHYFRNSLRFMVTLAARQSLFFVVRLSFLIASLLPSFFLHFTSSLHFTFPSSLLHFSLQSCLLKYS